MNLWCRHPARYFLSPNRLGDSVISTPFGTLAMVGPPLPLKSWSRSFP